MDGEPRVPTQHLDLLRSMVGKTLRSLIRYSWLPGPEASTAYGLTPVDTFELTAGPVVLVFEDGPTVGGSSQPSWNSVVVWDESASDEPLASDSELSAILACDPNYSSPAVCRLTGQRVTGVRIFHATDGSTLSREVPSEVAVELVFDSGDRLYLGHGLHDGSDDFAVLTAERPHHRGADALVVLSSA